MKPRNLTYLGGLAAILALVGVTSLHSEADFDNLAEAQDGTQTVTVTCTAPLLQAFVPNVSYTLSFPKDGTAVFSATSITAAGNLNGSGINGDADPVITKAADAPASVTLIHGAPLSKIAGLQCQTGMKYAQLVVRGVDSAADLGIAIEQSFATNWEAANQVDNTTKTIFGMNGLISNLAVEDGQDADSADNGEITFGGKTTSARHSLVSMVKYLGTTLANGSETLTYSFMPQANP